MDDGEYLVPMAAASSECSSGCQSGWTTYLDDHSSSSSRSCGTARFRGKQACDDYSEAEDDLSMISDASSGPRQQCSAGNDVVEGCDGAANATAPERTRGRRVDAASARRQGKKAAMAAASLLEDTASSPAFFGYSKETNGYGDAGEPMMTVADFSCAFSATTTGFKSPLNGTAFDGYLQMQYYSPAAATKLPMSTRQVRRDAGETKRW